MSDQTDIALAKQIARRAVARHERKLAFKLNAAAVRVAEFEASLSAVQQTVTEQSAELRDAAEAVSLLQERCASLERERDDARADANYHQRSFTQFVAAMQASSDYDHLIPALQRMRFH